MPVLSIHVFTNFFASSNQERCYKTSLVEYPFKDYTKVQISSHHPIRNEVTKQAWLNIHLKTIPKYHVYIRLLVNNADSRIRTFNLVFIRPLSIFLMCFVWFCVYIEGTVPIRQLNMYKSLTHLDLVCSCSLFECL